LQQGEWWPTANCNHTWNCLGRKEGRKNLGKKKRKGGRGGRSERREEETRGAQESRKTAAANSGDGRTDDSLLISLVGWDFKYSDLPNRVVVLESLFFFLPLPVLVKRLSPRYKILGDRYG
jgi:hypothetical protein